MINIPSVILISTVELLVFLIFVSSSSKTYALINPLINQVTISQETLPSVVTSSILAHPYHKVKNQRKLTFRTLSSNRNRNRRKRQLVSSSDSLKKFSAPSRASSPFKFDPVPSSKEEKFHSSSSYTFAPSSGSSSREEGSVHMLDGLNSDPETLYQSTNLNSYQLPSDNYHSIPSSDNYHSIPSSDSYHSIPSSFGSSPGAVAANQEFESMSQYFEGRIGHGHRLDPVIDASTPRNITTASGKTVFLPCRIRHLGDRTVGSTHFFFFFFLLSFVVFVFFLFLLFVFFPFLPFVILLFSCVSILLAGRETFFLSSPVFVPFCHPFPCFVCRPLYWQEEFPCFRLSSCLRSFLLRLSSCLRFYFLSSLLLFYSSSRSSSSRSSSRLFLWFSFPCQT